MYMYLLYYFKLLFLNSYFHTKRDFFIFINCILTITAAARASLATAMHAKKVASSISDEERRNTWSLLQLRLNSKQLLPRWWQTLTGLEIFMMHSSSMHAVQDLSSNALYSRPRDICFRRSVFEIR